MDAKNRLINTDTLGQGARCLVNGPAYRAYLAYVENDMAMRLCRKRKMGCSRVLRKNMGFPMTKNSYLS